MTYERRTLLVIGFLILLNVIMSISGCTMLQRASDVVFRSKPKIESVIPETPKAQLWQTVKGMTPNWLAIPVIALGGVAMFNGAAKLGMSCIIFGSVNLFMALATSRFGFWMAVCGLVGSCAAIAASILAKNKALKDVIGNVQTIKNEAEGPKKGFMLHILSQQTKSTKKIVQKIKNKAKLRGQK